MTMREIEQDILNDLEELNDTISQYSYLIACASECADFPEQFRTAEYLIKECQVNTWVALCWEDERCRLYADSEALLIKGALALLQEIYEDRTKAEVESYHCGLLQAESFSRHFTKEQTDGLKHIFKISAIIVEGEDKERGDFDDNNTD